MLRQLRLKNFVQFREEQTFDIDIGENDDRVISILGPSGSGKSCLLEAIRRCTESVNNESMSSIPDETADSIVICAFERPIEKRKFISIYLSFYNKEKEKQCMIKILAEEEMTKAYLLEGCGPTVTEYSIDDDDVKSLFDKKKGTLKIAEIIRQLRKKAIISEVGLFDKKFRAFTDIEFIFAVRPLGPAQSSRQLRPEKRSESSTLNKPYDETSKNAFIIREFYEARAKSGYNNDSYDKETDSDYDFKKEEEIFKCIVGSDKYAFTSEENGLFVTTQNKFPLLKAPEGAIEAKYLSILLSKKIDILCIDGPCRGMNDDMINRLIFFVLSNKDLVGDKQVILVSGCPNFLTSLRGRIYICDRRDIGTTKITSFGNLKTSLTDDHLTAIVFSARILFVEGSSDLKFIEAIRMNLLTNHDLLKEYGEGYDDLKNVLIDLKVVPLNTCTNVDKVEKACKQLGMGRKILFLLDKDALSKLEKYKKYSPKIKDLEKDGKFLWDDKAYDKLKTPIPNDNGFGYFYENGKWLGMIRSKNFENKPGTMEDIVVCESIQHDLNYHSGEKVCYDESCEGLIKALKANKLIVKTDEFESCGNKNHCDMICMREKFLLNATLTPENIETVVKALLWASVKEKSGEIWRLLGFLSKTIKSA